MSEKIERAKALFSENCNCSQSTFAVFSDELGLSFNQATSVASGFGGGMRMAKTCGAVSGAYMALGLYSGTKFEKPETVKLNTYELMKQFTDAFVSKHGQTDCKALLGVDITTEKGAAKAKEQAMFVKKCPMYVADAVEIVEKMLNK